MDAHRRSPIARWREQRLEHAARTGDTPEKLAEPLPRTDEVDVKAAADRASTGLVANGAAFNG